MINKRKEESLILSLITLGDLLKKRRDIISQNLGISTQQWLILLYLAKDPNIAYFKKNPQEKPMLASEIACALGVSRPNITNLLNVLDEKRLIIQTEDDIDRRRKRLELSEKGKELVLSLQENRQALNGQLFENLADIDTNHFLKMVENCIFQLENDELLRF